MNPGVEPRLLKKVEAARYCSLDPTKFQRLCPVRPIELDGKVRRWDRKALDAWLDSLTRSPETMTADDWLGERDHAAHGQHRADQGD